MDVLHIQAALNNYFVLYYITNIPHCPFGRALYFSAAVVAY